MKIKNKKGLAERTFRFAVDVIKFLKTLKFDENVNFKFIGFSNDPRTRYVIKSSGGGIIN